MGLTEQEIRDIIDAILEEFCQQIVDSMFEEFYQSRHPGLVIDAAVDIAHDHVNAAALSVITMAMINKWNDGITGASIAENVSYNNILTKLEAVNVQEGIDEVVGESVNTRSILRRIIALDFTEV